MTHKRVAVVAAVGGALLALALVVWLPVVRWGLALLVLWALLAVGLACRSAWRTGAARWSWQVGSGLVRAGRGAARDADAPRVDARAVVGQVVRAGAVLVGDRRVLVEHCRQLSPGVRAALLVVALGVAFVAVSACALVGVVWCLRHLGAGWRRVRGVLAGALARLEPTLERATVSGRPYLS